MITLLNILILLFSSFLTLSFLPHFRIFGAVPLLPLFFIIQLAYYRKGFEPILLAALTGIIFDLFSPYPMGFYLIFFLLIAGIVRYFFGEGMRQLSFWHYLLVVGSSLAIYVAAQIAILAIKGFIPGFSSIVPIGWELVVGFAFSILFYFFGVWYFEWILTVEDRLKRR